MSLFTANISFVTGTVPVTSRTNGVLAHTGACVYIPLHVIASCSALFGTAERTLFDALWSDSELWNLYLITFPNVRIYFGKFKITCHAAR